MAVTGGGWFQGTGFTTGLASGFNRQRLVSSGGGGGGGGGEVYNKTCYWLQQAEAGFKAGGVQQDLLVAVTGRG